MATTENDLADDKAFIELESAGYHRWLEEQAEAARIKTHEGRIAELERHVWNLRNRIAELEQFVRDNMGGAA